MDLLITWECKSEAVAMAFDLGHFLARRAVAQVAQLQRTAVAAALWSRKCALLLATTAAIAANAGNAVPGKVKLIPWSGRGDWCMATLFAAVSAARQQPAALFSARKLAGFLAGLCYGSMQPKAHGLDRVVAWRAWRACRSARVIRILAHCWSA